MDRENKFKLLYEYVTQSQTENKGKMQGETKKGPTRMTLKDIVDTHQRDAQDPADNPEPDTPLPAPLTNNHLSLLADLYSNAVELQSTIRQTSQNPNIRNNKHKQAIKNIHRKLGLVKDSIKGMKDDFNQLGIDT
jgi:hypothetical protein